MYSNEFLERFWSKVDKSAGPDGCWLWQASTNQCGYGRVGLRVGGKVKFIQAHRLSKELDNGCHIPDGLYVLHRCPNTAPGEKKDRRCVNPAHLEEGTHRDNMDDKIRDCTGKGHGAAPGTDNGAAKLDWEKVNEIRELSGKGVPQVVLGKKFGVSPATIGKIVRGETWKVPN